MNATEKAVFDALVENIEANGGSFGFANELKCAKLGIKRNQLPGYVTALVKKGLIEVAEPYYGTGTRLVQITLTKAGYELAGLEEP